MKIAGLAPFANCPANSAGWTSAISAAAATRTIAASTPASRVSFSFFTPVKFPPISRPCSVHALIVVRMHRQFGIFSLACAGTLSGRGPPGHRDPQGSIHARPPALALRGKSRPMGLRHTLRGPLRRRQPAANHPRPRLPGRRQPCRNRPRPRQSHSPVITPLDRMPAVTNYFVGSRDAVAYRHRQLRPRQLSRACTPASTWSITATRTSSSTISSSLPAPIPMPSASISTATSRSASPPPATSPCDPASTEIVQKAPVIYQDGRQIKGHYTLLAGNQVGFRAGALRPQPQAGHRSRSWSIAPTWGVPAPTASPP